MFVIPGPPWRRKIGSAGSRRACADPSDGKRDQARVRLVPVLRDDERAAVGVVVALLGRVVAVVEDQVAGLRTGRDRDRVVARADVEVAEAEHHDADDDEGDDARRREGSRRLDRRVPSSRCLLRRS